MSGLLTAEWQNVLNNMKAAMRNLQEQFMQRNIKTEFSKFEKYKEAIPHGGCVL